MAVDYTRLFQVEHPFWLQVLKDHSEFIRDSFAAKEVAFLNEVQSFHDAYRGFLSQIAQGVADPAQATGNYRNVTLQFIQWKQHLLETQMQGKVMLHLPPTFIDHMAREATEYVSVIDRAVANRPLQGASLALHSHLLWLPDASGHAGGIRNNLDLQEIHEYKRASDWMLQFETLYLEALEVSTKFRTGVLKIPSFQRFTRFSAEQITQFRHYLLQLKELIEEQAVLSTLHPLMPDHMAREAAYYCSKLTEV